MRVRSLKIMNLCGVEELELNFTDASLVGLVGRNGSGKSTVLSALRWQLTGELPAAHPTLARFRRSVAGKPASPSGAIGVYEIGGQRVQITSWLAAPKKANPLWELEVLKDEPDPPVLGATAVAAALKTLLGMDPELVVRYAFVEQDQLRGVLFGQRAARIDAFLRLIGASALEPARQTMLEISNTIEAPDLTADLAVAEKTVEEVHGQMLSVQGTLESARQTVQGTDLQAAQETLRAFKAAREASGALQEAQAALAASQATCDVSQKALEEAATNAEGWKKQLSLRSAAAAKAREEMGAHQKSLNAYAEYARVATELDQLQRTGLVLPSITPEPVWTAPTAPEKPERYDAVVAVLPQLRVDSEAADRAAADYQASKVGTCPVCGTACACCESRAGGPRDPVELIRLQAAAVKAQKVWQTAERLVRGYDFAAEQYTLRLNTEQRAWEAALASLRAKNAASQADYQARVQMREQRITELTAKAASCVVKTAPVADTTAWQAAIAAEESARSTSTQWEAILGSRAAEHSRWAAAVESVTERITALEQQVTAAPPDDAVRQAEAAISLYNSATQTVASSEAIFNSLSAMWERRKAELAALKDRQERNGRLRRFKDLLEVLRGVLHRDRLPARMMAGFMELLLARINEFLPALGARYAADVVDGEYRIRKDNGDVLPATDLSGGEACRFCVAYVLAVHKTFAAQLGILSMDEPTNGLEESGVGAMAETLVHLGATLAATNTQVFLSTHEPRLVAGFDRVVDVAAAQAAVTAA